MSIWPHSKLYSLMQLCYRKKFILVSFFCLASIFFFNRFQSQEVKKWTVTYWFLKSLLMAIHQKSLSSNSFCSGRSASWSPSVRVITPGSGLQLEAWYWDIYTYAFPLPLPYSVHSLRLMTWLESQQTGNNECEGISPKTQRLTT